MREVSEILVVVLIFMYQLQYLCYTCRFWFSCCAYSSHVVVDGNMHANF